MALEAAAATLVLVLVLWLVFGPLLERRGPGARRRGRPAGAAPPTAARPGWARPAPVAAAGGLVVGVAVSSCMAPVSGASPPAGLGHRWRSAECFAGPGLLGRAGRPGRRSALLSLC